MELQTIQEARPITVYSTLSRNKKEIYSTASVLSELIGDFEREGIRHSGMKIVIAETQNTLETPNSQLLSGPQTILLLPDQVKSGWDEDDDAFLDDGEDEDDEQSTQPTRRNLMIAKAKQAILILEEVVGYLELEEPEVIVREPDMDPQTKALHEMAMQVQSGIKRRSDIFE